MQYDLLNRVTQKTYADSLNTPAVLYCYDGKTYLAGACTGSETQGEKLRLTGIGNTNSASAYRHDSLGRWSGANKPPVT
jgi:hypothetical protein